jgi:hypothetical protein
VSRSAGGDAPAAAAAAAPRRALLRGVFSRLQRMGSGQVPLTQAVGATAGEAAAADSAAEQSEVEEGLAPREEGAPTAARTG